MKSVLVIASLALSVLAQQATITSPTAGTILFAGSTVTVTVQQDAATANNTVQAGMLVGFSSCGGSCASFDPATDGVGDVVFAGTFTPTEAANDPSVVSQSIQFTVPANTGLGGAAFTLGQLQAVGAKKIPVFNMSTVAVSVV